MGGICHTLTNLHMPMGIKLYTLLHLARFKYVKYNISPWGGQLSSPSSNKLQHQISLESSHPTQSKVNFNFHDLYSAPT
jgi:hypothetical protein